MKILLGSFERKNKKYEFQSLDITDESFDNILKMAQSPWKYGRIQDIEITLEESDVAVKDTVYQFRGETFNGYNIYIQSLKIETIQDFGTYRKLKCFVPSGTVKCEKK